VLGVTGMNRAAFLCVSKRDNVSLRGKKSLKERGAADYKGLDETYPCFSTKRKMGLATILEGRNGRLIGLRSLE